MAISIKKLLGGMVKIQASDMHLKVGQKPMIRLHGILRPVEHPVLTSDDMMLVNNELMPERLAEKFEDIGSVDYSCGLSSLIRFRVNAYHQRGEISLAIRMVSSSVPTIDSLRLPQVVHEFVEYRRGVVLVTGITGSGKSSTLAAIINTINKTRREHIITIEDPIEFVYQDDKSIIDQIEIGFDIKDYYLAMKNAVRQDPDIILLGELRDRITVETAMHAVETGHLVFSTLHTPDSVQTILRILHFFPKEDYDLVIEQLAQNLNAVICQRLLKRIDGKGRIPCCEVLIKNAVVQKLIRESRYDDMASVLEHGKDGMQTFDNHLVALVKGEELSLEEAMTAVHDEAAFKRALSGRRSGGDSGALIG